jgi:splicing suppressor protein 51
MEANCAHCNKTEAQLSEPLKTCAKCKIATYCSRDCQKAEWKDHKKLCGRGASASSGVPPTLPQPQIHHISDVSSILGGISEDALHKIPDQTDVYRHLIDSYRMRVEDEYRWGGGLTGLYAGEDPLIGFGRFLDLAERKGTMLPKWWNKEKRAECEKLGMTAGEWSNLRIAMEKSDIQKHYNDPLMPMKLRILAERIYGRAIGGRG